MQWFRKTLPSMQTTRRSSSPNGRPRNAWRRPVDSATNRRDTALLDVARSITPAGTGSKVPAYRRVDTPAATAASVCSSIGSVAAAHWKPHQRDFAVGAPPAEPRQLHLPPAKRHLAVYTPAAPHGPLDLVAPLRPAQDFPIRLHHRLQDMHPGRDAQDDME